MSGDKGKNLIIQGLVGLIFLIMAVEMFYLVKQNRTLRADIKRLSIPHTETIEIGSPAPSFTLKNLSGEVVRLSDFQDMNLILIFFSNECPGCLMDIPYWKRLVALENDTIQVLGVTDADREHIINFMDSYVLNFDVVIDPAGEMKEIYKCGGIPQKILINSRGKVAGVETGAYPHEKIGKLEKILIGNNH